MSSKWYKAKVKVKKAKVLSYGFHKGQVVAVRPMGIEREGQPLFRVFNQTRAIRELTQSEAHTCLESIRDAKGHQVAFDDKGQERIERQFEWELSR